ncbi:MAG: hypothetical protein Q8P53_00660 [Candidatus Shapirobacteria bacterium]|nr:hypothetical protein [Candidatus Shapirobacteria bacterium]
MFVDNPDLFADKFRVKSARLLNWNYSQSGFYFITICTHNKNKFLGKIVDGQMKLSKAGEIAKQELLKTSEIRKNIKIDDWVIMPNHVHLIMEIKNQPIVETHCMRLKTNSPIINQIKPINQNNRELKRDAHSASLRENGFKSRQIIPNTIKLFKAAVKSECNRHQLFFTWQARYYDRIIRTEKEYWAIKQYIDNNPKNWQKDVCY